MQSEEVGILMGVAILIHCSVLKSGYFDSNLGQGSGHIRGAYWNALLMRIV